MFDMLMSADYWTGVAAFIMNAHQAGFNMIPQYGWRQAIEAWAYDKIKD